MPAPIGILRRMTSLAVHGGIVGTTSLTQSQAHSTSTIYPPCPICGKPMRLTHDAAHSYNGIPSMFYCPEDGAALQRVRGTHDYRRMAYTEDGRVVPWEKVQTR